MPAEAGTVVVAVGTSAFAVLGQILFVQNAGEMQVSAIPGPTSLTLLNLENTGTSAYTTNAAPGTNIASGSKVCPGGRQGPAGGTPVGTAFLIANNLSEGVAATMRNSLGVVIGTNVQAFSGVLSTYAGINPTANVQTVLGAANFAAIRSALTLVVGTDVQPFDAFLTSIALLGTGADQMIYATAVNTAAETPLTAAGRALLDDATATAQRTTLGVNRTTQDYLLYEHQAATTVNGGDFTSGAWQTVPLSTEVYDTGAHGAIAASVITLAAGTYRFRGRVCGYDVDTFQSRLWNVDTGAVIAMGQVARCASAADDQQYSEVKGRFTIGVATQVRLEARCQTTNAGDGFGLASSFGLTEVYSSLELEREAG